MSTSINRSRSGSVTLGTATGTAAMAVDANKDRQHLIMQTAGSLNYGFSEAQVAGGSALALASTDTFDLWGYTGPLWVTGSGAYTIGELVI